NLRRARVRADRADVARARVSAGARPRRLITQRRSHDARRVEPCCGRVGGDWRRSDLTEDHHHITRVLENSVARTRDRFEIPPFKIATTTNRPLAPTVL